MAKWWKTIEGGNLLLGRLPKGNQQGCYKSIVLCTDDGANLPFDLEW